MVTVFNQTTVAAQSIGVGVARQSLLGGEHATGSGVLLDRVVLAAGTSMPFHVSANSVAWLMVLDGEATAKTPYVTEPLSDTHSIFLPPGFDIMLSTVRGASVLSAEIPDAGRIDPDFLTNRAHVAIVDWTHEPVFESERDARKRIPIVSLETCGTSTIKVEMVIFPPGITAPNHHCENADTVIYALAGHGALRTSEQSVALRSGDLVHLPSREWRQVEAGTGEGLRFLQLNAPGTFKTVWADPGQVSGWVKGSFDILGRMPSQDERERRFGPWTFYD